MNIGNEFNKSPFANIYHTRNMMVQRFEERVQETDFLTPQTEFHWYGHSCFTFHSNSKGRRQITQ